jgi:XTP/dITP diphosphohydrolase
MRELLIATSNKGKLIEFEEALKDLPFTLLGLRDVFPDGIEIEEPGETLEGNAIIKAMTVGKRSGMLVLSDDTGLEIDALDGAPGVKSARFAPGSDTDRRNFLLERMKGVPDGERGGRMRSVLAIYDPERGDKIRLATGVMEIEVAREPRGDLGFGYDDVLLVKETGRMHAEENTEQRNQKSHRGKALLRVKEILLAEFI